MIGAIFMTYNFLSQTNSSEFNLYEYVDDESLMIEATMGARMEYITNPYSYILTEDFESVRSILKSYMDPHSPLLQSHTERINCLAASLQKKNYEFIRDYNNLLPTSVEDSFKIRSTIAYILQKNKNIKRKLTRKSNICSTERNRFSKDKYYTGEKCKFDIPHNEFEHYQKIYILLAQAEETPPIKQFLHSVISEEYPELNVQEIDAKALAQLFVDTYVQSISQRLENTYLLEYLAALYLLYDFSTEEEIRQDLELCFRIFQALNNEAYQKKGKQYAKEINGILVQFFKNRYQDVGITNTELTQQAVLEKYLCKLLNICELKKTQYVKAVYIYEQCTLQEKEQLLDGFFLQSILYHHNKEYIKNMLKQIPLITEKMLEEGSVFNRRQVQYMQEWENFLLFIIEWNNRRIQTGLSTAPDSQIVCPVNGDTQKKLVEYQQKIHALEQQRRQEKKLEADKSALLDSLSVKEKEIQRLKNELEESCKDKKELIGLRNFLYQAAEAPENDTHEVDIKIMTDYLNQNVRGIIHGGHPNLLNKLKQLLPEWKVYQPEQKCPAQSIINADIVVIYSNHIDHSSYNDTIRKIRDSNSKILYLNATNIKSFIGSLYKECRKEEA